jgi:hypothetical protein
MSEINAIYDVLVLDGSFECVKRIINETNVNLVHTDNYYSRSVLLMAMNYCNSDIRIIDHFIDMGVDKRAVDNDNECAIHTAIYIRKYTMLVRLLQRGWVADIVSTRNQCTPIDYAIHSGNNEAIWILYSFGYRSALHPTYPTIRPYIRCASVAYTLIGIRKYRRSTVPFCKDITLLIAFWIVKTRQNDLWKIPDI